MDADSAVKLILAFSVGASLLLISFQIARILGNTADIIKELRKVAKNLGEASDMVLEDYAQLRIVIRSMTDIFSGISSLLGPFAALMKFFSSRKKTSEEEIAPTSEQ